MRINQRNFNLYMFLVILYLAFIFSVDNSFAATTTQYKVSTGGNHSCAIDDVGVLCWGKNDSGQTTVPSLSNPTQISLGSSHSCAIDDTGVVCWGNDSSGQSAVPALNNPTQISLGYRQSHSCAIDTTGVVCWGSYDSGSIPSLSNPRQIIFGLSQSCALDDSGVVCWGGVIIMVKPLSLLYLTQLKLVQDTIIVVRLMIRVSSVGGGIVKVKVTCLLC